MSNDTFSKILAFIGALILGMVTAVLYFFGVIANVRIPVFIGLGVSLALLVFLMLLLFGSERGWRCICRYASALLYAAVLSVVAAALLLALPTMGSRVIVTVLVGVWATLGFFALILFCMLVSCFISARCGCGSNENHCSSGSCRFG